MSATRASLVDDFSAMRASKSAVGMADFILGTLGTRHRCTHSLYSRILLCIKYIAGNGRNQVSASLLRIYPTYSQFEIGVYILISVCTYQYTESSLISIICFADIKTILVLILHFAGSKCNGILSFCTGDQL